MNNNIENFSSKKKCLVNQSWFSIIRNERSIIYIFWPVLILLVLLISCNTKPNESNKTPLPNTPETVSKQWQLHLDNNEITQAAALSTKKTKAWLTENTELFLNDAHVYNTQFLQMDCKVEGNQATCYYMIKEEGELIEDYFLLKKINSQWLVDLEDDTNSPELEEQIFKEMERELKLD